MGWFGYVWVCLGLGWFRIWGLGFRILELGGSGLRILDDFGIFRGLGYWVYMGLLWIIMDPKISYDILTYPKPR